MSGVLRMAPSPTGWLHIGLARTFLFNWLYASGHDAELRLRIENTDTGREVEHAVEQIQDSLRWLGIDWEGDVTYQLDRAAESRAAAERLVEEGTAYRDEGAIRFRMPDEGVTAYDDLVLGRIEVRNDQLEDLVIVRSDGRPTYNFVSPLEDMLDGVTHVVRGMDHVSNTPKQIQILRALGADIPRYAHVPMVNGPDGKPLSKRHGAQSVGESRELGYLPEALVNFLALLGWSYDDKTTIMSRDELVERFSFDRVQPSPATFDYDKLDWMNGVYMRALPAEQFAGRLVAYVREQALDWDEQLVRRSAPLVQEKLSRLVEFPSFAGFLFDDVEPDPTLLDGGTAVVRAARDALADTEPFTADRIEDTLRSLAERLELSPRRAFGPIRVAVTGSKVSPGLFESLELLGKERALSRLSAAEEAA